MGEACARDRMGWIAKAAPSWPSCQMLNAARWRKCERSDSNTSMRGSMSPVALPTLLRIALSSSTERSATFCCSRGLYCSGYTCAIAGTPSGVRSKTLTTDRPAEFGRRPFRRLSLPPRRPRPPFALPATARMSVYPARLVAMGCDDFELAAPVAKEALGATKNETTSVRTMMLSAAFIDGDRNQHKLTVLYVVLHTATATSLYHALYIMYRTVSRTGRSFRGPRDPPLACAITHTHVLRGAM